MKSDPPPYEPATQSQAALLPPLIDRLLTPGKSVFDEPQLPLISAEAPELIALKSQFPGPGSVALLAIGALEDAASQTLILSGMIIALSQPAANPRGLGVLPRGLFQRRQLKSHHAISSSAA